MIKKLSIIAAFCAALSCYAASENNDATPTKTDDIPCVCKNPDGKNCKNALAEYKRKRDLAPRHLHSKIKRPPKCKCECHNK